MEYHLTWLATGLVLLISLVLGIGSSFIIRDGVPRTAWAVLVALVFVVTGCASVWFEYTWNSTSSARFLAQSLAIGAMLTGVIYAMRDKA